MKEEAPPPLVPAAPSDLRGSASKTAITLTWVDNADNELGFEVERSTASALGQFSTIGTTAPNITRYVDDIGAGKVTYNYRVQAYNSTGPSDYSNTVVVRKRR